MWEKNGLTKILAADAVFPGSAPQEEVFQSVQGLALSFPFNESTLDSAVVL